VTRHGEFSVGRYLLRVVLLGTALGLVLFAIYLGLALLG
jgi:hypothetical protein